MVYSILIGDLAGGHKSTRGPVFCRRYARATGEEFGVCSQPVIASGAKQSTFNTRVAFKKWDEADIERNCSARNDGFK